MKINEYIKLEEENYIKTPKIVFSYSKSKVIDIYTLNKMLFIDIYTSDLKFMDYLLAKKALEDQIKEEKISIEEIRKMFKNPDIKIKLDLKPGELKRIDNLVIEKTKDGRIILYKIEEGEKNDEKR